ncbi:nuclease-related domain-containing protein [Alkalilimnicola sp. S0819]|uniref:nuclease-related domain-containing protein n=1 Tax=Alkalilimnicola sp. S0819 TaxID=2613922 RepID=UPI00186A06FD|nr:nuclease-related domain-containing protein [Alkalilimnicola sp. S0819]
MILKEKNHMPVALNQLQDLLDSPGLADGTRKAIQREMYAIRRGAKGERQCAFYLDGAIKDHPNRVLIHDLRIEHEGQVAQIDHLLINRFMEFWILESKSYLNGFRISPRGEFEYWSQNRYHAMPSPIEQAKRQARILEKLILDEGLAPRRLGVVMKPTIKTAVLVDPKTRVIRPDPQLFDTDLVIKADAFLSEYEKQNEQASTVEILGSLPRWVKKDTIVDIGRKLLAFHVPLEIDYRAKFGVAKQEERPPEPSNDVVSTKVEAPADTPESAPLCPCCGKPMVLRTSKRGQNQGGQFWGCPGYPKCRGIVAIEVAAPTQETVPIATAQGGVAEPQPVESAVGAPACPKCGVTMVLRTSTRGSQKGSRFWGCPGFPKCRGVVAIQ